MVYLKELTDVIEAKFKQNNAYPPYAKEPYGNYYIYPDKKVEKILCCVTNSDRMVEYAKKNGYDLIISHHPITASMFPQLIYHTTADCEEGIYGLNSFWKNFLEIKNAKHTTENLGWFGNIAPISFSNLKDKIQTQLEDFIIGDVFNTQQEINSIAVVTGLGGLVNEQVLKSNVDLYIVGQNIVSAKETGFRNIIELGHSLSERCFCQSIKEIIKNLHVECNTAPLKIDSSKFCYGETATIGIQNNEEEII